MTVIAANDLAKQLPHILQALAAGEEFILTEEGQPVADIIPSKPSGLAAPVLENRRQIFNDWMNTVEARAHRYPPASSLTTAIRRSTGKEKTPNDDFARYKYRAAPGRPHSRPPWRCQDSDFGTAQPRRDILHRPANHL